MYNPRLLLSSQLGQSFRFVDLACTEGDRVVELVTPEGSCALATPLRDNQRFVVETVPMAELEYTGITERLERIDERFQVRAAG